MSERTASAHPDLPRFMPRAGSRIAIAGGCGALGRRLVGAALAGGLEVAVLDLEASLALSPARGGVMTIAMDGTEAGAVHTAFARLRAAWPVLDHLFFLIGFAPAPPKSLQQIESGEWDTVIAGNLGAAHLVTREALPYLRRSPGATIVLVSSALTISAQPGYGPYIAAKAGLNGLVRALAIENAPAIRVNAVAPSAMLTPFMGGGTGRGGEDAARQAWFDHRAAGGAVPMGRLCEPGDVVGPMLFLASDAARFITGQILHVSGGRVTP